jgi:hypothetical protein
MKGEGIRIHSYKRHVSRTAQGILDLEELVSEKVTDFLKGIQDDPSLKVGKKVTLSDHTKLGDFDECQQYHFNMLVQNTSAQVKAERSTYSIHTDGGGGGGGSPNGSLSHR